MSYPYPYALPGIWYGPYPGPPPQGPPMAYGPPLMAPPPPPAYSPYCPYGHGCPSSPVAPASARQPEDEGSRYDTPDVPRVKIHVIQVPAAAVFSRSGIQFDFKAYNLPLSMKIPAFFKKIGAFKDKKVVEEAVEVGNGVWARGTKLKWGCQDVTTVGAIEWKRGCGLSAAADQIVWVVVRDKSEGN